MKTAIVPRFLGLAIMLLGISPSAATADAMKVPLDSIYTTTRQKDTKDALAHLKQPIWEKFPSSERVIFLVNGKDFPAAAKASRPFLEPQGNDKTSGLTAETKASEPIWVSAHLGISGSLPPAYRVLSVAIEDMKVRVCYEPIKDGGLTMDACPYLVWAPLGKLSAGEYTLELYDAAAKKVTATRKSNVTATANGEEPAIVFDNRPEMGVPREALAQKLKLTAQEKLLAAKEYPVRFHTLTAGTIKTVRIRYFNKETWKSETEAREYVAGFLGNKSSAVYGWQIWSQGVGVPEIECLIDFTDEYRQKLLAANKACGEGRLLLWNTEACFRDATGRWFFVDAFNHFHRFHPKGNRENVKGAKPK